MSVDFILSTVFLIYHTELNVWMNVKGVGLLGPFNATYSGLLSFPTPSYSEVHFTLSPYINWRVDYAYQFIFANVVFTLI
jgi:hypothetical protein